MKLLYTTLFALIFVLPAQAQFNPSVIKAKNPPPQQPAKAKAGEITRYGIAVGDEGCLPWVGSILVNQVVDENQLVLGLAGTVSSPTAKFKYSTQVVVKCPTAGIVDGQHFGTNWKKLAGSDTFKVTGTTKVNGTTLFVLEPKGGG